MKLDEKETNRAPKLQKETGAKKKKERVRDSSEPKELR